MALTTCPDCGTEVSDAAAACPKCARPFQARQVAVGNVVTVKPATSPVTIGCAILAGMVFLLIAVQMCENSLK